MQMAPVVYLAFKRVLSTSDLSWCQRFIHYWNNDMYVHVELLLVVNCTGNRCIYCRAMHTSRPPADRMHYLSYSVLKRSSVFCDIDRQFDPGCWTFVRIPVTSKDSINKFLQLQMGKPFNRRGCVCNFLCCFSCGAKGSYRVENNRWFCSELVTAALQEVDLFMDLIPCKTSPQQLYNKIGTIVDSTVCKHPNIHHTLAHSVPISSRTLYSSSNTRRLNY